MSRFRAIGPVLIALLGSASACTGIDPDSAETVGRATSREPADTVAVEPAREPARERADPDDGDLPTERLVSSARQALPGLNGYELPVIPGQAQRHAQRLAAERRDFAWARDIEARIRAELIAKAYVPADRIERIECRTTWCGVVIEIRDSERGIRREIGQHLLDTFGFVDGSTNGIAQRSGPDFVAIYLQAER